MVKNKILLDKINFNNTLITYKGKHSWPKENKILRAFDWLYLQKLKKRKDTAKQKKIITLYKKDFEKALKHLENNELIFASENYERIMFLF